MRKVIGFMLVLVFLLSISCVAFAAAPSNEGGGSHDECQHEWKNGICTECGMVCPHSYVVGRCSICGVRKPLIVNGNPSTGDVIMFWVAVMLASVAAMGGMVVLYRKKFRC